MNLHPRFLALLGLFASISAAWAADTLAPLKGPAPQDLAQLWARFDPRVEPLEIEEIKQWNQEGVTLRIVRFRIGVFKGKQAKLAAIYGFPSAAAEQSLKLPGLVQIHGGGQYADYRACLTNAKRGYATLSIAWAGRISAPEYHVGPAEVKLFWDNKVDDPRYRLTTDWGALDGYHAPSRNAGNQFPSIKPDTWTLDAIDSPRNSAWFLCALAARRALTFLEQQAEVDPERLGVYGHSMGGKLSVMTAIDTRVKAAAPSCGGISDRDNASELFRATLGDDVYLKHIACPIAFLSPANDFHGRIGDLPNAIAELRSPQWRITCSAHRNHQDTAEYEVVGMLWMDQQLKSSFTMPATPKTTLELNTADGIPIFTVAPDVSRDPVSVDIFYTQQGKANEAPEDREDTMTRFWHCASATKQGQQWTARLPLHSTDAPLWVYANVIYTLDEPVSGAGYYYAPYTTDRFNLSSLIETVSAEQLQIAGVKPTLTKREMIEDFRGDWEKSWFTNRPDEWPRMTNKLHDPLWQAPPSAVLSLEVQAAEPNRLIILLDNYAAEINIKGNAELDGKDDAPHQWQLVTLTPSDFKDYHGRPRLDWKNIRQLKLSYAEHLRAPRGETGEPRLVGAHWKGPAPKFRRLRWQVQH